MNNQAELFVKDAEEMEQSLSSALINIHTQCRARRAYIKYGAKCYQKQVGYSDKTIAYRANELGLKIISLTERSITLLADTLSGYYKAHAL